MTMLELALSYAARNWPVYPLSPMQKIPPKGTHGRSDATTDEALIYKWWTESQITTTGTKPEYNIGIDTDGANLVVIDIDTPDNYDDTPYPYGIEAWCKLVSDAGLTTEPKTYEVWTPSGGEHLYYRAMPGVSIKTIAGKLAPGIDVRATNGSIVAAGSKTKEGTYECIRDIKPKRLPVWLKNELGRAGLIYTEFEKKHKPMPKPVQPQNRDKYVQTAIQNEVIAVVNAVTDTANDTLFRAAASLSRFVDKGELTQSEIFDALYPAAIHRGQTHIETVRTIQSALK